MDSSNRRPCYVEHDNGLASIAGFSGYNTTNTNNTNNNTNLYYDSNNKMNENGGGGGSALMMRRRNSLRNMSCISSSAPVCSPRSVAVRVFDPRFEDHSPHFLESCFLCRKPLGSNRDIFMYRGDTPFCSEECRQEQIDKDEAKEKNRNFKAMRSKKDSSTSSKSTSTSPKRQNYPFRTSTVAAA